MIAAMEASHPHLTTQKSFYVEISRARDRAEFVTDDKAALKEQLEAASGERIAALEAVEPERAKGHGAPPGTGRDTGKGIESGARTTDAELEKARAPRSADRELGL